MYPTIFPGGASTTTSWAQQSQQPAHQQQPAENLSSLDNCMTSLEIYLILKFKLLISITVLMLWFLYS